MVVAESVEMITGAVVGTALAFILIFLLVLVGVKDFAENQPGASGTQEQNVETYGLQKVETTGAITMETGATTATNGATNVGIAYAPKAETTGASTTGIMTETETSDTTNMETVGATTTDVTDVDTTGSMSVERTGAVNVETAGTTSTLLQGVATGQASDTTVPSGQNSETPGGKSQSAEFKQGGPTGQGQSVVEVEQEISQGQCLEEAAGALEASNVSVTYPSSSRYSIGASYKADRKKQGQGREAKETHTQCTTIYQDTLYPRPVGARHSHGSSTSKHSSSAPSRYLSDSGSRHVDRPMPGQKETRLGQPAAGVESSPNSSSRTGGAGPMAESPGTSQVGVLGQAAGVRQRTGDPNQDGHVIFNTGGEGGTRKVAATERGTSGALEKAGESSGRAVAGASSRAESRTSMSCSPSYSYSWPPTGARHDPDGGRTCCFFCTLLCACLGPRDMSEEQRQRRDQCIEQEQQKLFTKSDARSSEKIQKIGEWDRRNSEDTGTDNSVEDVFDGGVEREWPSCGAITLHPEDETPEMKERLRKKKKQIEEKQMGNRNLSVSEQVDEMRQKEAEEKRKLKEYIDQILDKRDELVEEEREKQRLQELRAARKAENDARLLKMQIENEMLQATMPEFRELRERQTREREEAERARTEREVDSLQCLLREGEEAEGQRGEAQRGVIHHLLQRICPQERRNSWRRRIRSVYICPEADQFSSEVVAAPSAQQAAANLTPGQGTRSGGRPRPPLPSNLPAPARGPAHSGAAVLFSPASREVASDSSSSSSSQGIIINVKSRDSADGEKDSNFATDPAPGPASVQVTGDATDSCNNSSKYGIIINVKTQDDPDDLNNRKSEQDQDTTLQELHDTTVIPVDVTFIDDGNQDASATETSDDGRESKSSAIRETTDDSETKITDPMEGRRKSTENDGAGVESRDDVSSRRAESAARGGEHLTKGYTAVKQSGENAPSETTAGDWTRDLMELASVTETDVSRSSSSTPGLGSSGEGRLTEWRGIALAIGGDEIEVLDSEGYEAKGSKPKTILSKLSGGKSQSKDKSQKASKDWTKQQMTKSDKDISDGSRKGVTFDYNDDYRSQKVTVNEFLKAGSRRKKAQTWDGDKRPYSDEDQASPLEDAELANELQKEEVHEQVPLLGHGVVHAQTQAFGVIVSNLAAAIDQQEKDKAVAESRKAHPDDSSRSSQGRRRRRSSSSSSSSESKKSPTEVLQKLLSGSKNREKKPAGRTTEDLDANKK